MEMRFEPQKHIGLNRYIRIPFLLILIGTGLYYLITGIQIEGINIILQFSNILKVIFLVGGISFFFYIIYVHFFFCDHAVINENSLIGMNFFDKKRGVVLLNEIGQISTLGKSSNVMIKDIHGKKLTFNCVMKPTEEFFNEVIQRAVNCKKIDLRAIRERYPNIITYERGLDNLK